MYNNSDELNLELSLDRELRKYAIRLAPHHYALDVNRPRRISPLLKMPGPILATLGNFLRVARASMHK